VEYISEPIIEETMETICGVGKKLVNRIYNIIMSNEPKFYFLF
jgi:hypothetical protein